jgi:16S rRNA (cytosine967-C5)-methyltransferase
VSAARSAAFAVRQQVERGRRLDRAFAVAAGALEVRDRAFVHELTYGTTRLRGRLDHLIGRHVDRGLGSLRPDVLEVLRMGAYQALYMDAVPPFAAVSASVELVRSVAGARPAGLVNAVLRRVSEAGDTPALFPDPAIDPLGHLETWGSHPRWLLERWLSRLGFEAVAALVEADNRRPPTYLASVEVDADEAVERLAAAGVEAERLDAVPGFVRLGPGASPSAALTAVPGSMIQDPAAGLVGLYAAPPVGSVVVDLCAAPGGKAVAASARALWVLAGDRSEARIRLVRENARRTGRAVRCVVADALYPPVREADAILLDVPCSGTGTLSRHPDARWRLDPASIATFAVLQDRMLDAAATATAPGAVLVYSTCTLEPEENVDRIDAFLGKHPGFRIESAGTATPWVDGRGLLTVTPHESGFDGAFGARMRRME